MAYPSFIRALRDQMEDGGRFRHAHNAADGQPAVVTYNFMTSPLGGNFYGDPQRGFALYAASDIALTEAALAKFTVATNIRFVRGDSQSETLMFGRFDILQLDGGYATVPLTDSETGDHLVQTVYIDTSLDMSPRGSGYFTLLHEIGHAVGLKHPHEGSVRLPEAEDNSYNTVMSYTVTTLGPNDIGFLDIMALESLYGPPAVRNAGNTTHKLEDQQIVADSGGIDTLSGASLTSPIHLDLRQGSWNYIGAKASSILAPGQVWLGNFTFIENAVGSSNNDWLGGNDLANRITGGNGDDLMLGRLGADVLIGGNGSDRLEGGSGTDILQGKAGNDLIFGGGDADVIRTGAGQDRILYRGLAETGSVSSHDRVLDFTRTDRFDFRKVDANLALPGRQKEHFLGNFADHVFSPAEAGTFYFNTTSHELVFEANGDTIPDFMIGVAQRSVMKAAYFLV